MKSALENAFGESVAIRHSVGSILDLLNQRGGFVSVEGLTGASRALFLAHLYQVGPVLILSPDQNTAESLLGDLRYFIHYEKLKIAPLFFPSWELLPYEELSPLREISGERLGILNQLQSGSRPFLITSIEAALQFVMPRSVLEKNIFTLQKGDILERQILETCLIDAGYTRSGLVEERGQFSIRGGILDVFVPALPEPIRVEFFGDEVESLRRFDIGSQVSMEEIEFLRVLPVRELCLSQKTMQIGLEKIYDQARRDNVERARVRELEEKFQHLGDFAGIEMLYPFFYVEQETLFDYLPDDTLLILDDEELVHEGIEKHLNQVNMEYQCAQDRGDVAAPPENVCMETGRFSKELAKKSVVGLNPLKLSGEADGVMQYEVHSIPTLRGQFDEFAEHALKWIEENYRITIVAPTKGHGSRVHELLDQYGLEADVDLGRISAGFQLPCAGEIFVAEHEIFGRSYKHRYRRKPKSQSFQRGFKDLKPGDYLVHIDYGIGKYIGVRELATGLGSGEFLQIQYAGDEKLYIPMDSLSYLQKYIGTGEGSPPLDKLGGVSWKRQKKKVKEAIREMAEELLKLYAKREMSEGKSFTSNPVMVQEFADSFEFTETEDQMRAIDEVYEDLQLEKPMDRLICGDVGFGKTEVAMRAAFKVIMDKKQAAVMAPTTILAQQHFNTFRERFREYPIEIEMLSRFRTSKEQKAILQNLSKGHIDIIIGTHKLLGKDVRFLDLGLIIIDEEQRFGVRHKEKLKELRTTVDILTLTATPIPRTLYFSLMGVRDLSIIETPPDDRLSIKTYIRKFDEGLIREAILRELNRGGQVYFVHNKVQTIHAVGEMIRKIVPDVRFGIAHGQLPEKMLEEVMRQFIDKEIDLMLCSSIIESGLDIPSANTIIINRADQFGLGQLYQLRGRVGRYKHQAYAYLLIPGTLTISNEARKRLTAIEELTELGSGFQLASRDLEIRGAGNMLGHQQSGHVNTIGFDLYCKLIEEAVKEMKGKKVEQKIEPEIDLQIKGYIPKFFIPDLNQRLDIYRRIYLISEMEELEAMGEELADRYGTPPEEVKKLLGVLEIRLLCQKLYVTEARVKGQHVLLTIDPTTPISSNKVLELLDQTLVVVSEYCLSIRRTQKGWKDDLKLVRYYLDRLWKVCDVS